MQPKLEPMVRGGGEALIIVNCSAETALLSKV